MLSVMLPFLPPMYSGTKGILDIMSYSSAVAGIVTVLGIVFLYSVYFKLYGLNKDRKRKTKISVNTYVTSLGNCKSKSRQFYCFSAAGLPYRMERIPIGKEEYDSIDHGIRVIVNYPKIGKRFLSWIKV